MKRRLLMLLSFFMTITSVGWMQAQDTGDGYTQTGEGNYTVTTAKGLQNVLTELNSGSSQAATIVLGADLNISDEGLNFMGPKNSVWQGMFYLNVTGGKFTSLTIDGGNHKITGVNTTNTVEGSFDATKNYVFYFDGYGSVPVTFKNLTVTNTNILAFNLYNLNNLTFENVALNGNAEGGLHLNSSQLKAKGFTTDGNGKFAVKLSRQEENMPKFTLVSGTIGETGVPQIAYYDRHAYSEWSKNPKSSVAEIIASVVIPTGEKWFRSLQQATLHTSNNSALAYVWTKGQSSESITTAAQLDSTINLGFATITDISLAAGTYELSRQLKIDRPLALHGVPTTSPEYVPTTILKAKADATWPEKANLITISDGTANDTVTLTDLQIEGSKAAGINAQSPMKTVLDIVVLKNNATAGLLVHSTVDARRLKTEGNTWGGVNIDEGTPAYSPSFTFDANSTFAEQSKIWSELKDSESVVVAPADWHSYLGVQGASTEEMRYWTNSKLTVEDKINVSNDVCKAVFGNGNSITVEQAESGKIKISIDDNATDYLILNESDNLAIFGGKNGQSVSGDTKVTLKSGSVYYVFGGGYGASSESAANVSGTASVNVNGGTVTKHVYGGSLGYGKIENVQTAINGKDTKVTRLCAGGSAPVSGNSPQTTFDAAWNAVKNVAITINDATLKEGFGCGGGFSYAYTGMSTVTATNAKLGSFYGVLANGYADNIKATLDNCTFYTDGVSYREIGAINRGKIKDASFSFNKCTFEDPAQLPVTVSLGAIEGWGGSDTSGKPVPEVTGSVAFTFAGCTNTPDMVIGEGLENANVTLTGAKAILKYYERGSKITEANGGRYMSAFKIASGKTWTFNDGFEIKETEGQTVTLANNGKLNLPASAIMSAIEVGGALVVDTTSTVVVTEMNKATSKSDLSKKAFSIECKDGVIASNKEVAKELLKAGKVVMVLSFADGTYSIASFQKTLAKITNLPDSVVFGTAPITLAFNLPGTEVTISGNSSDVVDLKDGVLTIKKPGTVTFDLRVRKDTNNDGVINDNDKTDGSFTYDEDAASTQVLKVNKRKVTLTAGLKATEKTYDGAKTITLQKETLTFSGKLGTDATGLDLATGFTGKLADANAGENKEVIVTATLAAASGSDSTAFYELAPITFVKAKVTPKVATVTAASVSRNYGEENPDFTATTADLVTGDKLDGILKFTCSATKDSLAGKYDIIPYGQTSDNYTITFEKGTLTVNVVDPVIELTEAKTVLKSDNSAKEIQLQAKLIHAGGAKAISSVKFVQGSTDVTATLGTDGYYTGKFDVTAGTTYTVKASATAGKKTGVSKEISIAVDALTPQVVSFGTSVLPTMVYGNEMTLSATSDKTAATGAYTYSVAESDLATITDSKLKATGIGKVTLTVKRAADATHSAAVATKTIEITPKPITVAVGEITKVYDGTTAIETLPTFTLSGAAAGVAVKTEGLTLGFASKNVGESVKVLMPELTLTGTGAANYTLIQPTNVTGKITKANLSVKVKDVTRMWNQRYTKYEFEATGLVNGETLSSVYTGAFEVTEEGTALNLAMEAAKCANYALATVPGTLTVELGTPKAVVYGKPSDRKAMIVDEAGYTGLKVSAVREDGYANILDASDKVIGQSLNNIPSATKASFKASIQTKAAADGNWNQATFTQIPFGTPYEVTKLEGYTYESTNTNVLAVSTDNSGNIICTPVATGKATILAISASEVKILNLEVAPAELTISAANMDKTYDGTTLASGTVELKKGDAAISGIDVALDLSGITFNFADKKAGESKTITPSQPLVLIGSEANNYVLAGTLTGKIDKKAVTVGTPLSAYYNGKTVMELTDYVSNDRISGDIVPIKVTFGAAAVGEQTVTLAMGTTGDAGNYTLSTATDVQPTKGNILKSTIVAILPDKASSENNLKSNIKLTVRETGEAVTSSAIGFVPTVTSEGSGSSTVYYVNGGETSNYSVVYDKNQLGFKSDPVPPTPVSVESVSLDKTALTLEVNGTYTLTATINPSNADDQSVTWTSSDVTVATVDADGVVKALKAGKATITVTTTDGNKKVTCEVTVTTATGLEEALANTEVFGRKGNIYVNPLQPLQVTVVNMIGKIVYNARISGNTQIPVTKGIYIVKLTNAGNTNVTKVSVY
ncbi:YDG domain-containing protein [uncultured Parabacteroides sp.]|uniref:YDG domain-containing protein n=3 Tax=uncultured Parabacteroides sp. TaxID=512312 RepID=UPI00265880FD|nr:YDG domain-containing protein [uncultured Parabacteroides sp.]